MVSGGVILFQDYLPRDDGLLEVFPFTMIIQPESENAVSDAHAPRLAPIVLRTSERALLQFDRPFRLSGESAGKLKSGQLQGQVHVYRLPDQDFAGEKFSIWTSHVQLTPTRIFSLEDIEFHYGEHHGSGRNFRLDLQHDIPQAIATDDFSRINGLKRLELAFVKSVQLHPAASAADRGRASSRPSRGPMQITCRGPFVFDFEAGRGEFQRDVFVQSLDASGDSLFGQQLAFEFERAIADDSSIHASSRDQHSLVLRRIRLSGEPARILLSSRSLEMVAESLQYDLSLEQVVAADPKQVTLSQPGMQAHARQIRYRLRNDQSLGPLWAQGPGQLIQSFPNQPDQPRRLVQWQDQLTIEPSGPLRKVSVRGNVRYAVENQLAVEAQTIDAWLLETNQAQETHPPQWAYHPLEVEMKDQVAIESPRLGGTTDLLTLRWPLADQIPWDKPAETFTTYRAFRLPWSEFQDGPPPVSITPIGNQLPPTRTEPIGSGFGITAAPDQFRFAAEQVRVWVDDSTPALSWNRVEMDGQVLLRQPSRDQENGEEFSLRGGSLRLTPQGRDQYHVHVHNRAYLQSPRFDLQAEQIYLDQQANRVWAPKAGQLLLRPAATNLEEAARRTPDQIQLTWEGGIVFDGETIYAEHQVLSQINQTSATGLRTVAEMHCAALSLVLTQPIDMSHIKLAEAGAKQTVPTTQPEIERMTLVSRLPDDQLVFPTPAARQAPRIADQKVVLEKSVFGEQQQLLEYQQLKVPRLVVYQQQGKLQATGPGELSSWRRETGNRSGWMQQVSTAQPPNPSDRIAYLHLEYDTSLVGRDDFQHFTFQGRVRALQAPAAQWHEHPRINLQLMPPGSAHLTSDQLELAQWTPRGQEQPTAELIATGNARLRSETFEALAHRLSYQQLTDILEIEGSDREDAQLRYQSDPKTRDRVQLAAQKIRYRPSDQWMEIVKARNATIQRGR